MRDGFPVLDQVVLAAARLPGQGDDTVWYEVAAGDDGSVVAALGDAPSAEGAAQLHRAVRGLGVARPSPTAVVDCLDEMARTRPALAGSTVLCLTLSPAGVLRWAAAGPTSPLVSGSRGTRYLEGARRGPIGHPGGAATVELEEEVPAGTTVLLCSGGSPVAPGGADDPMAAAVADRHDLAPVALATALSDHLVDGPTRTLLLARLMPAPLEQRLPADPRRLATVRRAVATWSAQAALSDDATADLQLLLSEATTNAVEHAYRETDAGEFVYSVQRRRDTGVRVVVEDFGRWRPPPDDPGYRGRGLAVIHNLADDVSLDFSERGTRIAFTVPSDPPPVGQRPLKGVTQGWMPGR